MANYSIVVDTSNFKPYDMSIPLNILRDYREAYYRYEDALNKIAEENGMYSLPEPEEGNYEQRRIYDLYQKYNNEFRRVTDDFAKGMNWRNALMVRDINRRYGLEVKPVKQAVENYNKFLENKNSIRANRPEARFGKNPSVYDFVGGRTPELEMLDGEKIQATAAKLFTGVYNSSLHKDPQFKQSIIEGYDLMYKEGIPEKEALLLAMTKYNERTGGQHSKALNNYITVLNNYFDSLGIEGWDESEKLKVWGDIINGAVSAIPERKEELVVKKDLERALQRLQMQLARAEEARKALMHPLQMEAARVDILGSRLRNQGLSIANSFARGDHARQVRMDDLNYLKAAKEYDILLHEWEDKYGNPQGKALFNSSLGNLWKGIYTGRDTKKSKNKQNQLAVTINKVLKESMDDAGQVISGGNVYRFTNKKNDRGQALWVGNNGRIYTSAELANIVSTNPRAKSTSSTTVTYNDYVAAGYKPVKSSNGNYYVHTENDSYVMGLKDNKLYPTSVLNDPPAKSPKKSTVKPNIIVPTTATKGSVRKIGNYTTYKQESIASPTYWIVGPDNKPIQLNLIGDDDSYNKYLLYLANAINEYNNSGTVPYPLSQWLKPTTSSPSRVEADLGDITR